MCTDMPESSIIVPIVYAMLRCFAEFSASLHIIALILSFTFDSILMPYTSIPAPRTSKPTATNVRFFFAGGACAMPAYGFGADGSGFGSNSGVWEKFAVSVMSLLIRPVSVVFVEPEAPDQLVNV